VAEEGVDSRVHLVGGQCGVDGQEGFERVPILGLLNGLPDVLVDPEGGGCDEGEEGGVGEDGDEGEAREGEEEQQGGGEHRCALLYVAPVDEVGQWVEDR